MQQTALASSSDSLGKSTDYKHTQHNQLSHKMTLPIDRPINNKSSSMPAMKRKTMGDDGSLDIASQHAKKFKGHHYTASVSDGHFDYGHMFNELSHFDSDGDLDMIDVEDSELLPIPQIAHRMTPVLSRTAKENLAAEQVSFIIITRDNSKPDPYGQHSSTHGPLSWPAVADAYNKEFREGQAAVGSAAMEKRARQHREAWMAVRPDYPREIVYAKKVSVPKVKLPREPKARPITHVLEPTREAGVFNQELGALLNRLHAITNREVVRTAERSTRVAGWVPPDVVRNQDTCVFVESDFPTLGPDSDECITIEACDLDGNVGVWQVRTRDMIKTSALIAKERRFADDMCMTLRAPSLEAVGRYMNCISPVLLMVLPEFEGQHAQPCDEEENPPRSWIQWDFAALVDLYVVATILQDSHVHRLVLDRWLDMYSQNVELELDAQALGRLFDGTESDDPARGFWATTLYSAGLAELVVSAGSYHASLVCLLKDIMAK